MKHMRNKFIFFIFIIPWILMAMNETQNEKENAQRTINKVRKNTNSYHSLLNELIMSEGVHDKTPFINQLNLVKQREHVLAQAQSDFLNTISEDFDTSDWQCSLQ